MKIVTFNLRCATADDGVNNFLNRVGIILKNIKSEKADIIGFQEMTDVSYNVLFSALLEYFFMFNRRNSDLTGEGVAIAFLKEKYHLLTFDNFWLSETPQKPGSRYAEQSDCPRICQCALLQDKTTNKPFRVINTHLDHKSESARALGTDCVLEYIRKKQDELIAPYVLMGDMNAEPGEQCILLCNEVMGELNTEPDGTFHGFGRLESPKKIDYIFADKKTALLKTETSLWRDEKNGVWISDHYPVSVTVSDEFLNQ